MTFVDPTTLYRGTQGLSFASDFVETRQLCKEQKKWLMINIQVFVRSQFLFVVFEACHYCYGSRGVLHHA